MDVEGSSGLSQKNKWALSYKLKTKFLVVIVGFLVSTIGINTLSSLVYAGSDDYPDNWKNAKLDAQLDTWGYYTRECTSFAAWRLHIKNGFEMPWAVGDAKDWGRWANNSGYNVDMRPAIGSIAWFSNHVAWVEAVGSNTVTIEEYNALDSNQNGIYADDGTYSERTIMTSAAYGYIHFKDLSNPASSPRGAAGLTFLGTSYLESGRIMRVGQYIMSQNAQYLMVMQGDGNLVLYGPGFRALWASGTSGSGAAFVAMQADGNMVLYNSAIKPIWASGTSGRSVSGLFVQDDGNSVVYASSGTALWASTTGGHETGEFFSAPLLNTAQIMRNDHYLTSTNRKYVVYLQGDGNLVLYGPGYHVLWTSGTGGKGVVYAAMQGDGNLVLYTANWKPVWATGTDGKGYSFAAVQDDGNFVIYSQSGSALWATYTNGQI